MKQKIDYNKISGTFDTRYKAQPMNGVMNYLRNFISKSDAGLIAEIGCGTGYWMKELLPVKQSIIGIDFSREMLAKAKAKSEILLFVNGDARNLPFNKNRFDLFYLVNSIHLFGDIKQFLTGAFNSLKPNGAIDIIFADIRYPGYTWYIYTFFNGAYRFDLSRIPEPELLISVLKEIGFENFESKIIDTLYSEFTGREVWDDPFLQKNNTSTLAALSGDEYEVGIAAIKQAVENNPEVIFKSKIFFRSITARKKI